MLDAALDLFRTDPSATLAEIAAAAGIGRVTLHGHFPTRVDLVLAVVDRTLTHADQVLAELELDVGTPADALDRLVGATWTVLADGHAAIEAACLVLPPEQVDALHQPVTERLSTAVHRCVAGRVDAEQEGWLIVAISALMHAAAAEVTAGRAEAGVALERLRGSVAALVG